MMDRAMVVAVENFAHAGYPTDAAAVLLAEVAGHPAGVEAEAALIQRIAEGHEATSIRVAADGDERALLWKGRKSVEIPLVSGHIGLLVAADDFNRML